MGAIDIVKKWGMKNYQILDKRAIQEITLGASILATGGGGDPEIGLLWSYRVIDEGKQMIMVDPMELPDDILAAVPATLGAALVLTEKPPRTDVINFAIEGLEKYLGKKLEATIPVECGGVNSPVAYAAAAEIGVPVIDVDGMNRAFPELQMTSWVSSGVHASPTVSVDDRFNLTVIDTGKDDHLAETIARRVAMAYGGISWIASYPMTGKQVKETSILYSQSIAWEIGKAVLNAREKHLSPIEEVLKALDTTRKVKGYDVFRGKIIDIDREYGGESTKGFSLGRLVMEGIGDHKGSIAELDFQNELLILRINGEIKCLPPDLITILDTETGEPIRTDVMKYGYRGTILLLPAHERMRTESGIKNLFGPRCFGYDLDYIPLEDLMKL